MPNGSIKRSSKIGHIATTVQAPARNIHITPGINKTSLISTVKFAKANYTFFFDKYEVNIYNQNNTDITILRATVICGWRQPGTNDLWHIPLMPVVSNTNNNTVLVNQPPTKFILSCPPPNKAIFNVYKLKTQPKLVQYLYAAAGFPTKPTWPKAVKNGHYSLWPGLTSDAVSKHFPESEETIKGHACKTRNVLCSTKHNLINTNATSPSSEDIDLACPQTKEHDIFMHVYDVKDNEAILKIYTDQTRRFPKKSSCGNQYVMVMINLDSTFRLGGQIKFGIIYIHTQLNTMVYVGITTKNPKKPAKKRPSQARRSRTLPLPPPTSPQ